MEKTKSNSESAFATEDKTEKPTEEPTEEITDSGIQNEILDNLLQKGEDIAIVDIEFDEEKLASVASLPNTIGDRTFNSVYVDMGDGSYMHVAKSATLQDYSDYLYSLYSAGFSYYTSNVIGNNFYATFATKSQIVTAFYLGADKEVRVVVDDRSLFSLPGLESENEYEDLGLNSLTVVAIAGRALKSCKRLIRYCIYPIEFSTPFFKQFGFTYSSSTPNGGKPSLALKNQPLKPRHLFFSVNKIHEQNYTKNYNTLFHNNYKLRKNFPRVECGSKCT